MAPPFRLELDPDGDVELILEHPDAQKLLWSSEVLKSLKKSKKQKKKKERSSTIVRESSIEDAGSEQPIPEAASNGGVISEEPTDPELRTQGTTPDESGSNTHTEVAMGTNKEYGPSVEPTCSSFPEQNELRMLVSSRHLCLASSTFRNMLQGPFLEAFDNNGLIREIRAVDWDALAFLIVQDIIHGHNVLVPSSVSLELLAKIAAIVDYYDCHDVTEPFIDRWIQDLRSSFPSSYGKDCVLWMSISWVFLRVDVLREAAVLAVMGCQKPVETMGLPVPDALTRKCKVFPLKDIAYILNISPF